MEGENKCLIKVSAPSESLDLFQRAAKVGDEIKKLGEKLGARFLFGSLC